MGNFRSSASGQRNETAALSNIKFAISERVWQLVSDLLGVSLMEVRDAKRRYRKRDNRHCALSVILESLIRHKKCIIEAKIT